MGRAYITLLLRCSTDSFIPLFFQNASQYLSKGKCFSMMNRSFAFDSFHEMFKKQQESSRKYLSQVWGAKGPMNEDDADLDIAVKENIKSVQQFYSFGSMSLLGSGGSFGFNRFSEMWRKQESSSWTYPSEACRNRGRKVKVLATFSLPGFMSKKLQKSSKEYSSLSGDWNHGATGEKWQKTGTFLSTWSNRNFRSLVAAATPSTTANAENHMPEPVSSDKSVSLGPLLALFCIQILAPPNKTGFVITLVVAAHVGAYYGYKLKDVDITLTW